MKNSVLQLIFTLFIMFEGMSIHSQPYMDITKKIDFNSKHELIGIGWNHDNMSVSYSTFTNSYFRQSKLLRASYRHNNFGVTTGYVTGYDYNIVLLPVFEWKYENIAIEVTYIPPIGGISVLILTKKVVF